jgi:hypothetical protein
MATNNDYYSKLDDPEYVATIAEQGGYAGLSEAARSLENARRPLTVPLQTALMENRPDSSASAGSQTRPYDFNVPAEAVGGLKGKSPKELADIVDYFKRGGFPVPEPVKALVALRARQPTAQPQAQGLGEPGYSVLMPPTEFVTRREPPVSKPAPATSAPAQAAAAEDDYESEYRPGPKFNKNRIYDDPPASLEAWPDDGATEPPAQPQAQGLGEPGYSVLMPPTEFVTRRKPIGQEPPPPNLIELDAPFYTPFAYLEDLQGAQSIPVKTASVRSNVPRPVSKAIRPTTPAAAAPPPAPPSATPATPAPAAPPKVDPWAAVERQLNLLPMQSLLVNRPTVSSDAAAPSASTAAAPVPPVGGATPQGATAAVPPPVEAGADGDDYVRNLYLARLAAQNAAGFGGMGAGKNIDMGIADTLGERLKQVEALRAKRAQTSEERALEQQQYEGANLGTLTSNIASFKDRPEVVAALENLRASAKFTKPSDFLKAVYQAVMNPPTLAGKEAGVAKTNVQIPDIQAGTAVKVAKAADIPKNAESRDALRQAQADKARRAAVAVKQVSDTKLNSEVRAAKGDARAAEASIRRDLETGESDKLGVAANIRDFMGIEEAAPGFSKGNVPSWIGRYTIQKAERVPELAPRAAALRSALETFIAGIRKSLFGASLTGNEKASFDAIAGTGLTMPPEVLAANIDRLRKGAARFAQSHFAVSSELHPEVTGRVLRSSALYGPALTSGGVYSDVWTLPGAGASAATGAAPAGPSESQVAKLRANPDKTADFDAKFGPGAAAKILGGK